MHNIYHKTIPGVGDLNFVLIHNAGGNHLFFTHQIDMLRKHGNVTVLDLPGHGRSLPSKNNGMMASSEIICSLIQKNKFSNVVLVGLNNGANIALSACCSGLTSIKRCILIDPPLFLESGFIGEIEEFIEQCDKPGCEVFIKELVENLLSRTSQPNRDIAFNAFMQVDKASLKSLFRSLIEWDQSSDSLMQSFNIPTLCIVTDEHHCRYHQLQSRAPGFQLAKVVGSKCWATLEVPEQINAMIDRFLCCSS